ncbi:RES family NAD+ phosphorylase [Sphingomonas sp. HDW15A]|uniref:RES family NAD+ phosphorylase n=1 Tax=Sphingomonas sp. HDW15A TaxID=2714942 RepID=UPI001408746A|nr:RES family NAD+ phosphorylase [Sphingomonas sp. HDW15A]QIK95889.1 RES family NAD+ phosphorylase [Sphingomonas sp. HDW15A]
MVSLHCYEPPVAATGWRVYRIIPTIFPPVSIFDDIANQEDLDALYQVEDLTNDRVREEIGQLQLVAPEDRVAGPGTTPIMAAFTHLNPTGSRFTDGTYGVYYAATELETAIVETKYHREVFLAATNEGPIEIDQRVYVATITCDLHDLRTCQGTFPEILHPTDYSAGQKLGGRLRSEGSNGVIYASVRAPGGTCVGVFRPRCLADCNQERHLTYRWDGERINEIYEKSGYRAV